MKLHIPLARVSGGKLEHGSLFWWNSAPCVSVYVQGEKLGDNSFRAVRFDVTKKCFVMTSFDNDQSFLTVGRKFVVRPDFSRARDENAVGASVLDLVLLAERMPSVRIHEEYSVFRHLFSLTDGQIESLSNGQATLFDTWSIALKDSTGVLTTVFAIQGNSALSVPAAGS